MMRHYVRKCAVLLLCIGLAALLGCSQSSSGNSSGNAGGGGAAGGADSPNGAAQQEPTEETFVLKLSHHQPPDHHHVVYGPVYFMDLVEERTNGRVTFQHFPAEQAGALKDQLNLLQSGVVDIAITSPPYMSEKMPIGNAGSLPGWDLDPYGLGMAYFDVIKNPESPFYKIDYERHGIIPLWGGAITPYQVVTKKKVTTMDEMKGLRLRSSGGTQELIISGLGAVPVSMSSSEAYEAVERGTLDGLFFPLDSLFPWGLEEVIDNTTTNLQLTTFIVAFSISEQSFNKLPPDIQEIILQAGADTAKYFGEMMREKHLDAIKELENMGKGVNELPEGEIQKINAAMQTVVDQWEKDMNAQGFPATEALEEFRAAVEKYHQ